MFLSNKRTTTRITTTKKNTLQNTKGKIQFRDVLRYVVLLFFDKNVILEIFVQLLTCEFYTVRFYSDVSYKVIQINLYVIIK